MDILITRPRLDLGRDAAWQVGGENSGFGPPHNRDF
jgi:hypothetical protein